MRNMVMFGVRYLMYFWSNYFFGIMHNAYFRYDISLFKIDIEKRFPPRAKE